MTRLSGFLGIVALAGAALAIAGDDDLVVVVNKANSADNVTKVQLRKMMLGEQASWPSGKKVSVVLRSAGQPERAEALRAVCGMSEDQFNEAWMHASFNGDTASPPKALGSAQGVRALVMSIPGAIGFLLAADVNDTVKAITFDGVAAGQPGYKIKAGK
jgi:ABC-type phosphate transport system substrate-binding protein